MSAAGPTCEQCGFVHCSDDARALGRFLGAPAYGYRAKSGGPERLTRTEAEADECATRVARSMPPPH